MTALTHVVAILLLPAMMTLIIPGVIMATTDSMHIGLGLVLVVATIRLFATIGQGTLAPWSPTQKLVVRGVYRRIRNPMISGVFGILLGEAMLLGSSSLLSWFIVFVIVNLIYIPLLEEPGLEQRFGVDYVRYKQNVPRWIPRWTPWSPA